MFRCVYIIETGSEDSDQAQPPLPGPLVHSRAWCLTYAVSRSYLLKTEIFYSSQGRPEYRSYSTEIEKKMLRYFWLWRRHCHKIGIFTLIYLNSVTYLVVADSNLFYRTAWKLIYRNRSYPALAVKLSSTKSARSDSGTTSGKPSNGSKAWEMCLKYCKLHAR